MAAAGLQAGQLPPIAEAVVFVNCTTKCDGNGMTCYNKAHRGWTPCGTCGYLPENGVMKKAQLCCVCIHEGYAERRKNNPDAEEPCRCYVSLWWWDHEYDRRLEWLREHRPDIAVKVKPRPTRADTSGMALVPLPQSTYAAHPPPAGWAATGTDQPWRADARVDTPVPNAPQHTCAQPTMQTAAFSYTWHNGLPNTQRNDSPCSGAATGTGQHLCGSPAWLDGDNGTGGLPASSGHIAVNHIGRDQASGMSWQDAREMFGQLMASMRRIEARLATLEERLDEINATQQTWRYKGDWGDKSTKSNAWQERAEQ